MRDCDAGDGEDGDVVGLGSAVSEGLRGFSDVMGGVMADGLGAVEAEEFAGGGACGFDDAVGDESAEFIRIEMKWDFGVVNIRSEAERKVGVGGNFSAVEVGVGMSSVGHG